MLQILLVLLNNSTLCGQPIRFENDMTRIIIKQSEKSDILLSIALDKIKYIMDINATKYFSKENIILYINGIQEGI